MATNTTNLALIKPSGTDKIRIAQINSNMDVIDAKIGPVGSTSLQAQVNEKLPLAGGTLTGALGIATAAGLGQEVIKIGNPDAAVEASICKTDATDRNSIAFRQYTPDGSHRENFSLPSTYDEIDSNANYSILTTKPQTSIYTRLCPGVDITTTPSTQSNNDAIRFYDVNSKGFGYIGGVQQTSGQTNVVFSTYRNINGEIIYNNLSLGIRPDGTRVVTLSNVKSWLLALNLAYAAGDTYAEAASSSARNVVPGLIAGSAKQILFRVTTPKSMANISNISVTALTGWFAGINGIIKDSNDGSASDNTNWLSQNGVAVAAYKKSDNTAIIRLTCDSALGNATNGPCNGMLAFALSFS